MHVEIWSDIACPWCWVGKRRFERALELFEHADAVQVRWRSFELDPAAPADRGLSALEHIAQKYGRTPQQAAQSLGHLTEEAAKDGLELRFDRARGGNTFDAHRLVHLGAAHGLQDATKERLMRAYLTEGELMSDHATLARLAGEVGLDADAVAELLAGSRFADDVRQEERLAAALGISAVPFFVIDRSVGASGAHAPEALLELLERGWAARTQAPVEAAGEG